MKLLKILLPLIVIFLIVFPVLGIYGDWVWFSALNYANVFRTILSTQIILGLITGIVFFLVIYANLKITQRTVLKKKKGPTGFLFVVAILFLTLTISLVFGNNWETVLKFFNGVSFGIQDPVFINDISFYVFDLPFYSFLINYGIVLIAFSLLVTVTGYVIYSGIFSVQRKRTSEDGGSFEETFEFKPELKKIDKGMISHLLVLVGILFLLVSAWFYIERFNLLYSSTGVVFGAAYTDLNVKIHWLTILAIFSPIVSILFFFAAKTHRYKISLFGAGAFVGILVIGTIVAFIVQGFVVNPNEFSIEEPYIERNIEFTLKAYGLDDVDEEPFPVTYDLTKTDIAENKGTINNIRLWDWRPLKQTYQQLQLFRTYYNFNDVDVDRYIFDGEYKQVLLSARELDQKQLPTKAKTWVNEHLVYTHGYGLAMSPVDRISEEGLPELFVKDIPPKSDLLTIDRPEIYYGEQTDNFIVVKTNTEEFDYPKEDENVYVTYQGEGGIELSSFIRFVYALKFGSIELLVSGSINPDSKILLHRNIDTRVQKIAPFLKYDDDPYLVVSDNKLYWIYDAYTTTDRYPYSEQVLIGDSAKLNYIRNSVKIVIDAYNGDVNYYIIEDEPLINTYKKIFPDLFKDFSEMPEGLKKHIRYPENLLELQANLYSTYHMKDPRVFYNKEDVWKIPDEIFRGTRTKMEAYYIIMKLPGEEKEEFVLIIPFNPRGKENMIGWMAARSDQPEYGKLKVFTFSKQELVYGPMQIEARIDQDTEISQKITLWSQAGSDVIRGNLLVIPIENSILYVEPLYLQASESSVPQLKRVIVAFGNKLSMQESLTDALNVVFGKIPEEIPEEIEELLPEQLIGEALNHYNAAQDALKAGNFTKYAEEIEALGKVLEQLNES